MGASWRRDDRNGNWRTRQLQLDLNHAASSQMSGGGRTSACHLRLHSAMLCCAGARTHRPPHRRVAITPLGVSTCRSVGADKRARQSLPCPTKKVPTGTARRRRRAFLHLDERCCMHSRARHEALGRVGKHSKDADDARTPQLIPRAGKQRMAPSWHTRACPLSAPVAVTCAWYHRSASAPGTPATSAHSG